MGEYLRLLTTNDQEIPLATLQRAVPFCAVWPIDNPDGSGSPQLAIGPEPNSSGRIWAIVERDEVGEGTLGADEVAEFRESLQLGGPPSAVLWLHDYLGRVRAIYAIHLRPDTIQDDPDAIRAIGMIREALRGVVGGIMEYDDFGFTNESGRVIWLIPRVTPEGKLDVARLDESTGEWISDSLNLSDSARLSEFLSGRTSA
mgnify:CR=1 FL=1